MSPPSFRKEAGINGERHISHLGRVTRGIEPTKRNSEFIIRNSELPKLKIENHISQ